MAAFPLRLSAVGSGVLLFAMAAIAAPVPPGPAANGDSPSTLANLQAALAADIRAQARYGAFAERAQQDGDPGLATLFRAAAHAEAVHARLHAQAIRRLGSEPRAPAPEQPDVGTTRANLLSTLAAENVERAAVYPRYVDQARRDASPEAILAFTLAYHAEGSLMQVYRDLVGRSKAPASLDLHVCETCGHIVRGDPPERCPTSLSPRAAFTRTG